MMPDNDYYGHRTAMARYCGLKQLSPAVFGSIRHGWQPDLGIIGDRRIKAAPIFVWNEREQREAADRSIPNVLAIGAPFLYGLATMSAATDDIPLGVGTIVFPVHSDGSGRLTQDCDALIRAVEANEVGPFTVSIFYQDIVRPEFVAPFERAGWRIVSFGTRAEPMFLPRLILELRAHRTVVSNVVCSALWYGAHLGRRVRVLGPVPEIVAFAGQEVPLDHSSRWPQLYANGVEGADAIALAAPEVGSSSLRPPDELAELLGWRSWHRYAAQVVRLAIDVRYGNDLRLGRSHSRAMRRDQRNLDR
jgi:hypothetical protein